MDTKNIRVNLDEFKLETKGMTIEQMRKKLYADSPFDLATPKDDAFRDGVDYALELVEEQIFRK